MVGTLSIPAIANRQFSVFFPFLVCSIYMWFIGVCFFCCATDDGTEAFCWCLFLVMRWVHVLMTVRAVRDDSVRARRSAAQAFHGGSLLIVPRLNLGHLFLEFDK